MTFPSFIILALKRAVKHAILTLFSIVGVALAVGLVASIPIFTESVGMQILKQELAEEAYGNVNPPLALRYYRVPSAPDTMTMQQALDYGDWLGSLTQHNLGLPVARRHIQIGSHAFKIRALPGDTRYSQRELGLTRINCILDVEDQIEIVEGLPFSEAAQSDELIIWTRPELIEEMGLQVGERYEFFNYNANHPDQPVTFRVGGTWEAKDPAGPFWYTDPHKFLELEVLTSVEAFSRFVAPIMPQQIDYSFWYYVLDDRRLRFDHVEEYARGAEIAQMRAEEMIPSLRVDRTPIEPLRQGEGRSDALERLLLGFSLPVLALLLVFISAISAITVRYQRRELSILMSRGASHSQTFTINALEGLLHIVLGTPLGLLLSVLFAQNMSRNSGFLTFDRLEPLPLALQGLEWRLVALMLVAALASRLIPTLAASRRTIVTYGQSRARARRGSWAIRLLGLVSLCLVTAYSYLQVSSRGTFGMISWEPGGETMTDPLLFLAPTLFMITISVIVVGIFPALMRIPDLIAGLLGPSLYIGLRNLSRQSRTYTASLFLLVMCLCLGSFQASVALSADSWLADRLRYQVGADYSFRLTTKPDGPGTATGQDSWLLPITEYRSLPGVIDATRVGEYTATPSVRSLPVLHLFAIDRADFARVAYWREDYAPRSLGDLMNQLAQPANGLLIAQSYLEETGLNVGDRFHLDVYVESAKQPMEFEVAGTFDYFPTAYSNDQPAAVANLDFLHDQVGGSHPFKVWLRAGSDFDVPALRAAFERKGIIVVDELDSRAMILEDAEALERVGIYGTLTVGFLAASVLAWLGLLVYTVGSLMERVQSFAILRAIGGTAGQIIGTVGIEYLGVSVFGIVAGAAAGVAASRLFVPYLQFTQELVQQVPPFVPHIAWTQILWLSVAYFLVLTISGAVVLVATMGRRAFQALRLGDQ